MWFPGDNVVLDLRSSPARQTRALWNAGSAGLPGALFVHFETFSFKWDREELRRMKLWGPSLLLPAWALLIALVLDTSAAQRRKCLSRS
jgi:hypothetical protein